MSGVSRTYENIYPFPGVVTIALTKEIKEIGIYVSLLEYNETQGMLLISELSRRRFRSVNKLIKIGKKEIVTVIRVNKEKGYIDVSKRQVVQGETQCMEKKWNYSKFVNTINGHVAKTLLLNCEDCRLRWIWPMYRKFKHAIYTFKKISRETEETIIGFDISLFEFRKFFEILKKKIPLTFQKIEVFFELTCFSEKGILDLKDSLEEYIDGNRLNKIEICMVVSPLYKISLKTKSKRKGMKIILNTLKNISFNIIRKKGDLSVKDLVIH